VEPGAVPVAAPVPEGARAALSDPPELKHDEEHVEHETDLSQEPAAGFTEPQEHQGEVEQDSADSMHETEARTHFNEPRPMSGSETDSEPGEEKALSVDGEPEASSGSWPGAEKALSVDGEQESPGADSDTESNSDLERTTAEECMRSRDV
jgi:hypothetical protein